MIESVTRRIVRVAFEDVEGGMAYQVGEEDPDRRHTAADRTNHRPATRRARRGRHDRTSRHPFGFASVYRNSREAKDFEDFVGQLSGDRD